MKKVEMTLFWLVIGIGFIVNSAYAEFIGVPKDEFKKHYRSQKESMWCWASSAEMVLSYQGINLPQDEIVKRVKGILVNQGGTPVEMVASTNAILKDTNNNNAVISGQYVIGAPLPTVLYNQLKQKKPIILTYQSSPQFGHAVVLTGAEVRIDPALGVLVDKLYVFDPFSYQIVPNGWGGVNFIEDKSRIYAEYLPKTTPYGIAIPPGIITGVILMNGTRP